MISDSDSFSNFCFFKVPAFELLLDFNFLGLDLSSLASSLIGESQLEIADLSLISSYLMNSR